MYFRAVPECRSTVGPSNGIGVRIENDDAGCMFHARLEIPDYGCCSEEELWLDRGCRETVWFQMNGYLTDSPTDMRGTITVTQDSGTAVRSYVRFKYLPRGWFDTISPSFCSDVCGYAKELASEKRFEVIDMGPEELYGSMSCLQPRVEPSERFRFICDPDQMFSFCDGTDLDAAMCMLCSSFGRGYDCRLLKLGPETLVGICTEPPGEIHSISRYHGGKGSFTYYRPFDSLKGVPMVVSMDKAYNQAKHMV